MLSPESLRKELAIAEQVAMVATRAPEVRVQAIDPGREPGRLYNSALVPLRTWPSIPFPDEPQHELIIPTHNSDYTPLTRWPCTNSPSSRESAQRYLKPLSTKLTYLLRTRAWELLKQELDDAPGRVLKFRDGFFGIEKIIELLNQGLRNPWILSRLLNV